ncbi:hypothetical protein QYE76_025735 [Lolium multiflorum]|uniref:Transposase (putative) gypsy type domain-containing protein n=1 Tax=Lolium multiflorum TaxID=4521 RepID=A0AAD8RJ61_LOLMU|nr:hypothetical protein QYE76_025735 [Lolium multiflorum]
MRSTNLVPQPINIRRRPFTPHSPPFSPLSRAPPVSSSSAVPEPAGIVAGASLERSHHRSVLRVLNSGEPPRGKLVAGNSDHRIAITMSSMTPPPTSDPIMATPISSAPPPFVPVRLDPSKDSGKEAEGTSAHPEKDSGAGQTEHHAEEVAKKSKARKRDSEAKGKWWPCTTTEMELRNLEAEGFLQPGSWRSVPDELAPAPRDDEMVLTKALVERGFSFPPSDFFLEILKTYGLQPHNISPNSVLAISNHVTLCEGHLRDVSDPASEKKLPPFKNCPATEIPAWSHCPHLSELPQLTRASGGSHCGYPEAEKKRLSLINTSNKGQPAIQHFFKPSGCGESRTRRCELADLEDSLKDFFAKHKEVRQTTRKLHEDLRVHVLEQIAEIEGLRQHAENSKRDIQLLETRLQEETAKHSSFDELSAKVKVLEAENESLKAFIQESSSKETEARKELSEKHARDLAELNEKLERSQGRVISAVAKNKVYLPGGAVSGVLWGRIRVKRRAFRRKLGDDSEAGSGDSDDGSTYQQSEEEDSE